MSEITKLPTISFGSLTILPTEEGAEKLLHARLRVGAAASNNRSFHNPVSIPEGWTITSVFLQPLSSGVAFSVRKDWEDAFAVQLFEVSANGFYFNVRRLDANGGWGNDLFLMAMVVVQKS